MLILCVCVCVFLTYVWLLTIHSTDIVDRFLEMKVNNESNKEHEDL